MKEIPATTPRRYLTGASALNIPAPERTSGDWHFQNAFFLSPRPLQLAGDGPGTLVDTNDLFGGYGVHECSEVLKGFGLVLPEGMPVYAANHYRAILDLLISTAKAGQPADYLSNPEEWLDTQENVRTLVALAEQAQPMLGGKERETVSRWKETVLS